MPNIGRFSPSPWSKVLSLISIKPCYFTARCGNVEMEFDQAGFSGTLAARTFGHSLFCPRTEWVEIAQNLWSFGLVLFHSVVNSDIISDCRLHVKDGVIQPVLFVQNLKFILATFKRKLRLLRLPVLCHIRPMTHR